MKMKLIAGLLVICCLILPISAFAAEPTATTVQFSKQEIEVDKNASSFSVDILLNSQTPFSSAEFGVKTDSHAQLKSVTYSQAIGSASQVAVKEKNGISYFGFFDTTNHFTGSFTACTLTFTYTDSSAAVVTLAETSLTRLTGTGGATSESLTPNKTLQITRSASDSNPGGGPIGPGNTGNSGDGDVYSHVIDNVKALEALEHAALNDQKIKTISFDVTSLDVGSAHEIAFQLPYSLFSAEEKRQVEINTPYGTVTIPDHVIPADQLGSAQSLTLHIKQVDPTSLSATAQQQVEGRPVLELFFELDGKKIEWKNEQASVQVVLPYTLSPTEKVNADLIVAAYIDGNGQLQIVPTGRFHAEDGKMSFSTTHFSLYTLVNRSKAFTDTASSWARQDIEALAIRGIINGTTADKFSPNANITRADFTKLLVGVLGKHAASAGAGFKDVSSTAYYYESVLTAQALGLASGSGDGKFNPGASISRQDMMVLLDRAFTAAGHPLTETATLSGYKDAAKVSAYAKPSVEKLIASGIINGSNGNLTPLNNLTRAEAAKVLHLLYNELY